MPVIQVIPKTIVTFIPDFAVSFRDVLITPKIAFAPDVPEVKDATSASMSKSVGFAAFAITISLLLASFTTHAKGDATFMATFMLSIGVFLLVSWTIFTLFYFAIAILLGGKANFFANVSAGLRIKAVSYVFAMFSVAGISPIL